MFSEISKLESNYTQIPNDMYLVTDNAQEDCLLFHLLKLQGKKHSSFASLKTLGKYMHTTNRNSVEKTIKSLKEKGYIDYIKGNAEQNLANEYSVNMDKILSDINSKLDINELGKRAKREITEKQRDAMTVQRSVKNPELAHKAEALLGNTVIDENAVVLNGG